MDGVSRFTVCFNLYFMPRHRHTCTMRKFPETLKERLKDSVNLGDHSGSKSHHMLNNKSVFFFSVFNYPLNVSKMTESTGRDIFIYRYKTEENKRPIIVTNTFGKC